MRKIIVLQFMSIDGVVQGPGGPGEDDSGGFKFGGWVVPYFDEEAGKIMGEQMSGEYDLLLGRKTFDIFSSYWPQHASDWPGINEKNKYVVSTKLKKPDWNNSVVIGGDVVEALKKLKQEGKGNLQVHGSGELVKTLLKHGLVDGLWLKTFPVILGKGKRLFDDQSLPTAFKLVKSVVTSKGVVVANYQNTGEVKTSSFLES